MKLIDKTYIERVCGNASHSMNLERGLITQKAPFEGGVLLAGNFDEIKASVGQERPASSWILIDQTLINSFADLTNDHAFIHVDPDRAKHSPLGGTVAHGLLTLSLLPTMANEVMPSGDAFKMMMNYGYDKIRFLAPVHSGKRIRGRFKILDFSETKPSAWRQLTEVTVEIEAEPKPALIAEWITLIYA